MKVPRWIITAALIVVVSVTAGVSQQPAHAAPFHRSSMSHGVDDVRCGIRWLYSMPYQHCTAVFQPGTVADANQRVSRYAGHVTGGAGAVAGFMCSPAGPVAFVCAVAAAWRADVFLHALGDATSEHRCVQLSWDNLFGVPVPENLNLVPFGQPPRYLWTYDRRTRDWDRSWGNPDECNTIGSEPGLI